MSLVNFVLLVQFFCLTITTPDTSNHSFLLIVNEKPSSLLSSMYIIYQVSFIRETSAKLKLLRLNLDCWKSKYNRTWNWVLENFWKPYKFHSSSWMELKMWGEINQQKELRTWARSKSAVLEQNPSSPNCSMKRLVPCYLKKENFLKIRYKRRIFWLIDRKY